MEYIYHWMEYIIYFSSDEIYNILLDEIYLSSDNILLDEIYYILLDEIYYILLDEIYLSWTLSIEYIYHWIESIYH
jgi:hypothetical protein